MTLKSINDQPFIITNGIDLERFDSFEALVEYAIATGASKRIITDKIQKESVSYLEVEDFLNRLSPRFRSENGSPLHIFSVYKNLKEYVEDMCFFDTAAETAFKLQQLSTWGFNLIGFFSQEEIEEFAKEEYVNKHIVDLIRTYCTGKTIEVHATV